MSTAEQHPSPPRWPRTDRPLSIALLGWARLSSQGREGSGYNLNASELARGLALSGHRVAYLQSGMGYRFSLARLGAGAPRIAHRERWGGIDCFELLNAPNAAPAALNFTNTDAELACPATARPILHWLDSIHAQVVHIHSLEGYALDLIARIEASGRPVVVTPHNYWYLCPQVDLLHQEARVCEDYDGGRRCIGCLPGKPAARLRRQRAVGQSLERLLGQFPADAVRKAVYGIPAFLRAAASGRFSRRWKPPVLNPDALADPELALGYDHSGPPPGCTDDSTDGTIAHALPPGPRDQPFDYDPAPIDQNERMLAPAARDRHLRVLNHYGRRRAAGITALSVASLVTPPSDFLRRVHVSMGVPDDRTRWVRLGQPHFDQIHRAARRDLNYTQRPWAPDAHPHRPLRFGFLGTTRPNKGLEVLTRAIPLLTTDTRRRCKFIIRAAGHDAHFRERLARFPEVIVSGGYDLPQLIASTVGAGGEYDVGILSHIWLENSPLVLLENLHAGKFVLCSRLGGPADFVFEPGTLADHPLGNGLLLRGGDEYALAVAITSLIDARVTVPSPAEVHALCRDRRLLQSYPAHVAEVEAIYRDLLAGRAHAPVYPASQTTQSPPGNSDHASRPDARHAPPRHEPSPRPGAVRP